MAKDLRGNELKEGDAVNIFLPPGTAIIGQIAQVRNGGIVTGMNHKQQQVTPGLVEAVVMVTIAVDPTQPVCQQLLKLHATPGELKAQAERMESAEVKPKLVLEN